MIFSSLLIVDCCLALSGRLHAVSQYGNCTDWQGSLQLQDAALARNGQREGSKRMPEEVVRRMAEKLEEPNGQRYEWEQNTIVLPSESLPQLDDPQV